MIDASPEAVRARLREARRRSFSSNRAAAAALGIPVNTYSAHESGQRIFGVEQIAHYAKTFGVEPEWLAFGKGPPVTPTLSELLRRVADEIDEAKAQGLSAQRALATARSAMRRAAAKRT